MNGRYARKDKILASDANIVFAGLGTKGATYLSAALTIGDTPRRGEYVRVINTAASTASGSAVLTHTIDVSYDGGSTFVASQFAVPPVTLTTTSSFFEVNIPIEVSRTDPTKPVQIKLVGTISGASGSGLTWTVRVDIVPGR